MTSWFDTKQLTSLAKNALSEAQKTLDKALDIQEGEEGDAAATGKRRVSSESSRRRDVRETNSESEDDDASSASSSVTSTASAAAARAASTGSKIWGSFTGSFFDAGQLKSGSRTKEEEESLGEAESLNIRNPVVLTSPSASNNVTSPFTPHSQVEGSSTLAASSLEASSPNTGTALLEEVDEDDVAAITKESVVSSEVKTPEIFDQFTSSQLQAPTARDAQTSDQKEAMVSCVENQATSSGISQISTVDGIESTYVENSESFESSRLPTSGEGKDFETMTARGMEEGKQRTNITAGKPADTMESSANSQQSDELNSSISSSHTVLEPTASSALSLVESKNNLIEEDQEEEEKEEVVGGEHEEEVEMFDQSRRVSNLIDEAMMTSAEEKRNSETSSSKSYEVVRSSIGDPTSGDDDLETNATSSDIEVIASPTQQQRAAALGRAYHSSKCSNGSNDNSNRQQRHWHMRSGSEISAAGSEESGTHDADHRLIKRIAELNEVLEARELKLVELSKTNLELEERNTDLSSQVKEAMKINAKLSESSLTSEEMTNRLSDLERRLQKTISEKEALLEQNKQLNELQAQRMSAQELHEVLKEKNEIIDDLRREGEQLSKQVGKHSDVTKKLRTKEKATEKELKQLRQQLEESRAESDRLRKSLQAKEEVEGKQIEAIRNLTSANSRWEEEHNTTLSDLEDAQEKTAGLRLSLESAYREIAELKRGLLEKQDEAKELALAKETEAKVKIQEQLRKATEEARKEKESLLSQLDEARAALGAEERAATRREDSLRQERDNLMARLAQSEDRHEELSASVSAATRPLLRQIESLQAGLNEAQAAGERVERSLSERLQQASVQLAAAQERERNAAEQYMQVSSKVASLESKVASFSKEKASLLARMERETARRQSIEDSSARAAAGANAAHSALSTEVATLRREKEFADTALENERAELSAERRKNISLADQLKNRDRRMREIQTELDLVRSNLVEGSNRSSPTTPISHFSLNGSVGENYGMWPDEVFDSASRSSNFFEPARQSSAGYGSAAATVVLEGLQSQLKQKDGELVQLQMELDQLERSRDNLSAEVTRLTLKMERLEEVERELEVTKEAYRETEQKYQTMLTMYGEKVEEAQELRLDLADVKEMYKTQIEELIQARCNN